MRIRFWGVRGSVASPGRETVRYGGNTSCISVQQPGLPIIVFDAGTGIRMLGDNLEDHTSDIIILSTHSHWDHIQGFPYFDPIYQEKRNIITFRDPDEKRHICALVAQMDGAHFPVKAENLPSRHVCVTWNPVDYVHSVGIEMKSIPTNHPGGGRGYQLTHDGRTMTLLTDNELFPPGDPTTSFDEFADFVRGTELLIHDAQYLDSDMPRKSGWGHSLVDQACDLAEAAAVKHLVLFHHDPGRTDDQIDAIQANARSRLQASGIQVTAAFEGLEINL